jgi:hypothetical protein
VIHTTGGNEHEYSNHTIASAFQAQWLVPVYSQFRRFISEQSALIGTGVHQRRRFKAVSPFDAHSFLQWLHAHRIFRKLHFCFSLGASHGLCDLVGNTDDAASRARSRVAGLLGLLVAALAEIVGARMGDDGALGVKLSAKCFHCHGSPNAKMEEMKREEEGKTYAQNAMLPNQLNLGILNSPLRIPLRIGLDIPQIAHMSITVARGTVALAEGVEVRASRGAAVGVVAKLVDVEAALGVGVVAGDVVGYGCGRGLAGLLEGYGPGDLGVASEDGHWWKQVSLG